MKEICSLPVGQRMQKAYHDLVWTQSKDALQIQATPLKKVKKGSSDKTISYLHVLPHFSHKWVSEYKSDIFQNIDVQQCPPT